MQFIINAYDGTDDKALERRMAARPEHLENMKKVLEMGKVLCAGGLLNEEGKMIGSFLVMDFATQELFDKYLESEPYGVTDQPKFINGVARVETNLSPEELLDTMLNIENKMGRGRLRHWGGRNIDLDLLLYDDVKMQTEKLTLPHPDMQNRDFVMKPLSEVKL